MFVDLAGILLLYQGLQVGNAFVVAPIASSFSAVTAALAFAFGERVRLFTLSGIVLTIVGVIGVTVTGSGFGGDRSSRVKVAQGAMWAIGAALLLGTAFFGLRYPALAIGGVATVWIKTMPSHRSASASFASCQVATGASREKRLGNSWRSVPSTPSPSFRAVKSFSHSFFI